MHCYFTVTDSDVWCPREFDGWSCVNRTKAGGVATFPCPYFILGFDSKRKYNKYTQYSIKKVPSSVSKLLFT